MYIWSLSKWAVTKRFPRQKSAHFGAFLVFGWTSALAIHKHQSYSLILTLNGANLHGSDPCHS